MQHDAAVPPLEPSSAESSQAESLQSVGALPNPFSSNSAQADHTPTVYRFKFHGQAMEYFGIWIVNILLTIATLSLYAPWAKVRRLRYFYANTQFFHRFFDFTGLPRKILIGRLIALGVWGFFFVAGYLEMAVAAFGGLIMYLLMPWLVRATIRFNARNTKFANSRFYFSGTTKEAYKQFFFAAVITIFSVGLFFPVAVWLYRRYFFNHLYVGQLNFRLNTDWSAFMSAFYIPIGIFIAIASAVGLLALIFLALGIQSLAGFSAILLIVFYVLAMLLIWPLIQARMFILTWKNTSVGNSRFDTDCNQWRYAWIVASNWLVKILSLGLMSAWAAIRIYRYQVESLSLYLVDSPDQMINIAQKDHSAIAEEISDIFDLDISL